MIYNIYVDLCSWCYAFDVLMYYFLWGVSDVMTYISWFNGECYRVFCYAMTNVMVFLFQWRLFQRFPARDTNGYNPRLFYWLYSWIVSYLTSNMPGDSPIISSDGFLVLQFDYHFRIWWDFWIKRLIYLKLCIHIGCGPPTWCFRHCDCNTNIKYYRFGA